MAQNDPCKVCAYWGRDANEWDGEHHSRCPVDASPYPLSEVARLKADNLACVQPCMVTARLIATIEQLQSRDTN